MTLLFNAVIAPSLVFLLAALLCRTLRRASASARHAVWAAAMVCAVLSTAGSFALPKADLPILPELTREKHQTLRSGPAAVAARAAAVQPVVTSAGPSPGPSGGGAPQSALRVGALVLLPYLQIGWLLGFTIVIARWLFGIRAARRLTQASGRAGDERRLLDEWRLLIDALRMQFGISKPFRVVFIDQAVPPMTTGVARIHVLLPASAGEWPEERRRSVLAHELAHVKRRDGAIQLFVQLVCAIYWFNPAAWYAAARLRMERELACDDCVLSLGVNACDYADHLLAIARAVLPNDKMPVAAIPMVQRSQLEIRLQAILDPERHRLGISGRSVTALLVSSVLLTLLAASVRLTARTREPEPTPPVAPAAEVQLVPAAQPPRQVREEVFTKLMPSDPVQTVLDWYAAFQGAAGTRAQYGGYVGGRFDKPYGLLAPVLQGKLSKADFEKDYAEVANMKLLQAHIARMDPAAAAADVFVEEERTVVLSGLSSGEIPAVAWYEGMLHLVASSGAWRIAGIDLRSEDIISVNYGGHSPWRNDPVEVARLAVQRSSGVSGFPASCVTAKPIVSSGVADIDVCGDARHRARVVKLHSGEWRVVSVESRP